MQFSGVLSFQIVTISSYVMGTNKSTTQIFRKILQIVFMETTSIKYTDACHSSIPSHYVSYCHKRQTRNNYFVISMSS